MKISLTSLVALVALGLPVSSYGEENKQNNQISQSDAQAGIDIRQRFLNKRGFVPYDALILEPSFGVSRDCGYFGRLEVSYVGHFGSDGSVIEHDLSVSHKTTLGPFTGIVSWSRYDFMPKTNNPLVFEEVSFELKLAVPFNPEIFVAYDYRDGSGLVAEVSIGSKVNVLANGLDLRVALLFNKDYNIEGKAIPGIRIDAALPLPLSKRVTLTPHVRYFMATNYQFKSEYSVGVDLNIK